MYFESKYQPAKVYPVFLGLANSTVPSFKLLGWYEGTKKLTSNAVYSVTVKKKVTYTAKFRKMTQRENIEAFVYRMYTVALNRKAETAGLKYWSDRLELHIDDGAGIANGFIGSMEFVLRDLNNNDYVDTLYKTFFDRPADAKGKAYWMSELLAGKSRHEVLAGFVNSIEFDNLCKEFGIIRGTMQ